MNNFLEFFIATLDLIRILILKKNLILKLINNKTLFICLEIKNNIIMIVESLI